jgi:hypothetical protein
VTVHKADVPDMMVGSGSEASLGQTRSFDKVVAIDGGVIIGGLVSNTVVNFPQDRGDEVLSLFLGGRLLKSLLGVEDLHILVVKDLF